MLKHRDLTGRIIGSAIEVHRTTGPGLLESVYSECLADELRGAGIPFQRKIMVPVVYKGRTPPLGFRADLPVANASSWKSKPSPRYFPRTKLRS